MSYSKNQMYTRLDMIKLALDTANATLANCGSYPADSDRDNTIKSCHLTIGECHRQLREYLAMDIKEINDYE
jgi:hypothetical protein